MDHGYAPYFYSSHGSSLILKMAEKCRTLMETQTKPLCLWRREVLKTYKICQNLTK